MISRTIKSRYIALSAILFYYLLPIVFLIYKASKLLPQHQTWEILSLGLLFCSFGGLLLFWMIISREQHIQDVSVNLEQQVVGEPSTTNNKTESEVDKESLHKQTLLETSLNEKILEITLLNDEKQRMNDLTSNLEKELSDQKVAFQEQILQHEKQINESHQTIIDQRTLIEKKHQQVALLETKVRDLTYEIKTLLQLAEIENSTAEMSTLPRVNHFLSETPNPYQTDSDTYETYHLPADQQVHTEEEASNLLKRCVDIAQKITGASYYNNSTSRIRNLSVDNHTLDLRRLFDSLRGEKSSTIIFYSQKENKILFVNNQSKNLLDWSPEKFLQNFTDIILDTSPWKHGLNQLSVKNEIQINLVMKSKSGEEVPVHCMLGLIPTGLFRQHVIGVFYPDYSHISATHPL